MNHDSRLARMLHVLVHMHLLGGKETSETIALMLNTNPVVVRRTMAALREGGIVTSEGGRGGGWRLARPLEQLTALDVHRALTSGEVLAIGLANDHPHCPVERAVNTALTGAFDRAEAALAASLQQVTLADIAAGFSPPAGDD